MLSIIVPIFNRETHLRRCLDSLVKQTYTDIEIILVDDGSTDRSGCICDEYAAIDNRIVVIHQENQGVVAARRNGYSLSTGDYIAFVDSDDWVEWDMYATLMHEVQETNAERVFCDFYQENEAESKVKEVVFENEPPAMLALILAFRTPIEIWDGLFKRELVKRTFEICISNVAPAEDYLFNVVSLCLRPKLAVVKKPLYHYNMSSNGFVNNSSDILYDSRFNIDAAYQFLAVRGLADSYLNVMYFTPIRIKINMLKAGNLDEAINLYPYSGHIKEFYSFLPSYIRWIYWGVFNWGIVGKGLFILYTKCKMIVHK